jgi:hypothetical protein
MARGVVVQALMPVAEALQRVLADAKPTAAGHQLVSVRTHSNLGHWAKVT